jgi:enoyl-[acyl-carrier protein] reductase/trans-2-enoyl-CoA reductase (NAD+)
MGGEDWYRWIQTMASASVLARNAITVAFSYIGPAITDPIYRRGTIGRAKEDLELTAKKINREFDDQNIRALISVNKALVTRASAVIPAVTLYISLLYRVMKKKGIHEGCIQQMYRLFRDYLYAPVPKPKDSEGRIRLDDLEMREDVQREVAALWNRVNSQNIESLSDINGFREEFLRHHGFGMKGVYYGEDVVA